MNNMLSNAFREFITGPLKQLIVNLGGQDGDQWEKEFKKFLRNDPCSVETTVKVVKHTVDLSKASRLPFDNAEVVKHEGKGLVEIELRSDDNLYIDGKKIVLYLSERQMGDRRIIGHELRKELEGGNQVLLNSNVLDYLYDHPELFPKHWKKNEQGETLIIFFWGSIFRRPSDGYLYVRCLVWRVGELDRDYRWLDFGWTRQRPSASVAS